MAPTLRDTKWYKRLRRPAFNIRSKIIVPYFLLTLVVAAIGIYVVTSLVAGSLDERLNNHLLEAGRVVSDTMVRHEMNHLESARLIAYTRGLAEAMDTEDREVIAALATPAAAGLSIENLIIVNAQGEEMLHLMRQLDGTYVRLEGQTDVSSLWIVRSLLQEGNSEALPRRGVGQHPQDQQFYYFTAVPITVLDEMSGVIVIGTSLDTLLAHFKATSLADVTLYLDGGRAVASTFVLINQEAQTEGAITELSISPQLYESCLLNTETTLGENIRLYNRWYRLARGPLQVGNERLGVFGVALPSNFILEANTTSRNTYVLLFTAAMAAVILVGYLVSQQITVPLHRLVRTSQAVAEGDLTQSTDIHSRDEIGTLANTFDHMTGKLAERTRALEELLRVYQEASGRMRAILLSIGDGVLLEDTEGNLIPQNAAAEQLLVELETSSMLDSVRDFATADDATIDSDAWLLEGRRLAVERKMINVHAATVRTDSGERLGKVIVLRDVTAEVEAERLKDAFVAHVSHELRTPLTAIKGYSDLLLTSTQQIPREQQASFLQTISRHTHNLMAMVDELLDFSEMEATGQLGLQRQLLQISDLAQEIADEWRANMEEKNLTFDVTALPDLPLVEADPRRLRWALINLVRNAWQYTPDGGRISICLSVENGHVVLDVSDSGVGISPEEQQRLFTRFQRSANKADDKVRGMGLGLYVTHAIIEAHGGDIQVVSEVGKGSTFSVRLPASTQAKAEADE